MSVKIAIAGAGISGLATAYALQSRGYDVTVFEARSRAGGPVHTIEREGYRIETGPHTLLLRDQVVADLLAELGLEDAIVEANRAAKKRFIVRNGQPLALPMSPVDFVTTPLLSPAAKLRLLAEPLIGRFDEESIDETLASFIQRRLGAEALDYLVDPFVGGIWAGDPSQLSARHTFEALVEFEQSAGSIAAGAIKKKVFAKANGSKPIARRLISFNGGMKTLVDALSDRLGEKLRLNSPVRKLRRDDDGWRVIFQRGRARRGESFDAVVSTLPTAALASLEWENAAPPPGAIDELSRMSHAPCSVVSLGFARQDVGHPLDGFGVLVPRVEKFSILGALFVSTMFEGRAPQGCVNLTAFVGGARQPELAESDDQTLINMVCHDLNRLLDISGDPQFTHLTRWHRAIPQYEVGHQILLDRISELERHLPDIYFAGNYRDGISIPDLLRSGQDHALQIDDAMRR